MTTTYGEKARCAICGTEAMYSYIGSTNRMGDSDLDGRPSEMERSTIGFWIHICRKCHYVAPKISDEVEGAREVVKSEDYKAQLNREGYSKLANLFLCRAMILRAAGQLGDAGRACLHAAWVCDDNGLDDKAIQCRKIASDDVRQAIHLDPRLAQRFTKEGYAEALLVDILRRSEQFDDASTLCIEALTGEDKDNPALKLLAFQQGLIEKKDTRCYTVGAADL